MKLSMSFMKCKHCGKNYGDHKAHTLNCPKGRRTRIGYCQFEEKQVFEARPKDKKIMEREIL